VKDCKFKDIQNAEELIKKSSAELYGCGCERCLPVAKEKELAELRAEKQTRLAQEAARQEEQERIKALEDAVKSFEEQIEAVRREEREKLLKEKGLDKKGFLNNPLFHAWMNNKFVESVNKNVYLNTKYGREQLSPEVKNFVHWARTGEFLYKDLAGDTGSGSTVVPDEMYNQIVTERDRLSIMRRAGAHVIRMSSDRLRVPVESSRGNNGAWRGQGAAYTPNDPTLVEITLDPAPWGDLVKVSQEMLQDSAVNVAEYLARLFGRRLAYAENAAFINGDGTGKPKGINQYTANMISVTADAASIKKTVSSLFYALPEEHRMFSVWFIHGATLGQLAQVLGDTWFRSYADGQPPTLLGRPIYEAPDIPGEGASFDQYKIFFGDVDYYKIGERVGITVSRSTERYFDTGHIAFRADARVDGKLGASGNLKPFAYATAAKYTG
jgi:HK97 family phage major capsid protein